MWSEYYSEDADGIWMSEYSDEEYWSMSTYDPYTGRNVYQSGDSEGNFWMSVEEEDGTWSEEYHGADGSMELTRYENDGSMTKEVIEADGTSYNVATDWEGNESYERHDEETGEYSYEWEDESGRSYEETWADDGSASVRITNPDETVEVQVIDEEGNTRMEYYDKDGNLEREESIYYYALDDGTFVMEREDSTGERESTYFQEDGSMSTVRYDAEGNMLEEEYFHEDGSSTRYYTYEDGTEVWETEDAYGQVEISTYNMETGANTYEYSDYYGNWITEEYDYETGELTRMVEDAYGQIFVERYDAEGNLSGDVEVRDKDGYVVQDEVENDDGTISVSKADEDGNMVTETWDPMTGEASIVITYADGTEETYQRDWEGNTIVSQEDDGMTRTEMLITEDGEEMTRSDHYGDENEMFNYHEVVITDPETGEVIEEYSEDYNGYRIEYWEVDSDGTTEIMKVSPDGLIEQTYREYADGSSEEEIYEYLCEDCWDYTYERIAIEADGRETYEFTDAYGNTNTESYDENGNEFLGEYTDDEGWTYTEWIDENKDHHSAEVSPDGDYYEFVYHTDGTYTYMFTDDSGNMQEDTYDINGFEIADQYLDDATGDYIYVKYDQDGNMITETVDGETGERTEVKENEEGLTMVYEEWDP